MPAVVSPETISCAARWAGWALLLQQENAHEREELIFQRFPSEEMSGAKDGHDRQAETQREKSRHLPCRLLCLIR